MQNWIQAGSKWGFLGLQLLGLGWVLGPNLVFAEALFYYSARIRQMCLDAE